MTLQIRVITLMEQIVSICQMQAVRELNLLKIMVVQFSPPQQLQLLLIPLMKSISNTSLINNRSDYRGLTRLDPRLKQCINVSDH